MEDLHAIWGGIMKNAIRLLGLLCTFIMFGTGIWAGLPPTPPLPPQAQPAVAQAQAPAQQVQTQPKTTVKISNNSGYNVTITYHYYKIPENNPTRSSAIIEKGASTTLELLPNTPFSFALTAEGAKSPDVQVNSGDFTSGSYDIKPPATPLVIPVLRPTIVTPAPPPPAPAPVPTAQPGQPIPPTPPAKS